MTEPSFGTPDRDCALCPRLVEFRHAQRAAHADWHNAPVPSFGPISARILMVGLAPGLRGANRTGRPFTGDYAGDLLYATLLKLGLAHGDYDRRPDDGLTLSDVRVTNAVRCVPPENKPIGPEQKACRPFLIDEIATMPNLRGILCLGAISHNAVLTTVRLRKVDWPFAHGALHRPPDMLVIADSYHCSRLNTNTGRLTAEMFEAVVAALQRAVA